jgi:hypothetical protein
MRFYATITNAMISVNSGFCYVVSFFTRKAYPKLILLCFLGSGLFAKAQNSDPADTVVSVRLPEEVVDGLLKTHLFGCVDFFSFGLVVCK